MRHVHRWLRILTQGSAGEMTRKILLDSEYYDVTGDLHRRNINPRAARFETGVPGYSSFTQASVEAWKGMRGGIGHKYQESSGTEECWWSEGLDASHDAGIILGPKVNTAGAFGNNAYTAWVQNTSYSAGVFVKATTYNSHIYECKTGGTSAGTEPTWPTTDGTEKTDNTVTWTCRSVVIADIFNFGGKVYAYSQNMIAEWDVTNSDWDAKETGLADPIDHAVFTDSTATYAVVSSATAAKYTTDGATWTTLTGCMGYLTAHDNKLYGFYGQTINYSPAKDIDGTWSTCKLSAYLGTVHGLFTARSQNSDEPLLCLHTSEKLWTIDPWVQEIYPYIELTGNTYAGMAGMFWNSYIYCSTGPGIKKVSPGLITDVGPDQNDGLPSGYQGVIYDMIGMADGSWMAYCVNGQTLNKSSIIKRHGTVGGNQQVYTTTAINTPITCLNYSPSSMTGMTNGRLWWGEGINIKYCMMPDFNTDVTEISGYEFASTGYIIYSIFRPLEAFTKLGISVAGVTKNCASNKPIAITYYSDNDTDWQTFDSFTSSPQPTALSFGSGAGLEFRWIKLKATLTTISPYTTTPELRSLELDYDAPTKPLRGWTFLIHVSQHNAEAVIDALHTTQEKNTLVLFYPSGSDKAEQPSYRVKITTIAEEIHWDANREEGDIQVTVEELLRR